jgi:hypothetical protein
MLFKRQSFLETFKADYAMQLPDSKDHQITLPEWLKY